MIRPIPFILVLVLCSCKTYKQDILFQFDENFTESDLATATEMADSNYELGPSDILRLDVFTNKGERLIDPNQELATQGNVQIQQQRDIFQYIIQADGSVEFPLIGKMNLDGLTLFEAELAVAAEFDDLYKDSFVKLRIANRRVFVLGSPGGTVIPLENENTGLVEILALAGGIEFGAKAHNIKLIRGDLAYQIDLSTISGLQSTNMNVEPGDIIYVEPWRRPFFETLKDVTPVLSLASSITTLIIVIVSVTK